MSGLELAGSDWRDDPMDDLADGDEAPDDGPRVITGDEAFGPEPASHAQVNTAPKPPDMLTDALKNGTKPFDLAKSFTSEQMRAKATEISKDVNETTLEGIRAWTLADRLEVAATIADQLSKSGEEKAAEEREAMGDDDLSDAQVDLLDMDKDAFDQLVAASKSGDWRAVPREYRKTSTALLRGER